LAATGKDHKSLPGLTLRSLSQAYCPENFALEKNWHAQRREIKKFVGNLGFAELAGFSG
jgi:hypothetical protein